MPMLRVADNGLLSLYSWWVDTMRAEGKAEQRQDGGAQWEPRRVAARSLDRPTSFDLGPPLKVYSR